MFFAGRRPFREIKITRSARLGFSGMALAATLLVCPPAALPENSAPKHTVSGPILTLPRHLATVATEYEEYRKQKNLPSIPAGVLQGIVENLDWGIDLEDNDAVFPVLAQKSREYLTLKEELTGMSSSDPEVLRLREEGRRMLNMGHFPEAEELFMESKERHLASYLQSPELGLEAAKDAALSARIAKLRFNPAGYARASAYYAEADAICREIALSASLGYRNLQAHSLYDLGMEFGDTEALEASVELWQQLLEAESGLDDPRLRLAVENSLGSALLHMSRQDSGTTLLHNSIASLRAALEKEDDLTPMARAVAKNNLGSALRTLGERENRMDSLREAVELFRFALQEYEALDAKLDWAAAQNNLGNALLAVGERESGTERLKESVKAFQAALGAIEREKLPLDWGTTQNNLGSALLTLGKRETGTERLEEAIAAFKAALEERQRDRAPVAWAATQNNLGSALRILGGRASGTDHLKDSIVAYNAALTVYTREQSPMDWAGLQNNLGNTFVTLGKRESDAEILEKAVTAYQASLLVRTRDQFPVDWAMTQNNLANALMELGKLENGTTRLEEAVAAFNAAVEVFEGNNMSYRRKIASRSLARAQELLNLRQQEKP